MTKIDFYLLNSGSEIDRQRFACRLADKIYLQGRRVHIHTDDAESAQQLDALLWSFRDRSFIPHAVEPRDESQYPVTIGHQEAPAHCEVLVNLAPQPPNFFSRFERVAEVVGGTEETRTAGRERYRYYRDQGYPLEHHAISSN